MHRKHHTINEWNSPRPSKPSVRSFQRLAGPKKGNNEVLSIFSYMAKIPEFLVIMRVALISTTGRPEKKREHTPSELEVDRKNSWGCVQWNTLKLWQNVSIERNKEECAKMVGTTKKKAGSRKPEQARKGRKDKPHTDTDRIWWSCRFGHPKSAEGSGSDTRSRGRGGNDGGPGERVNGTETQVYEGGRRLEDAWVIQWQLKIASATGGRRARRARQKCAYPKRADSRDPGMLHITAGTNDGCGAVRHPESLRNSRDGFLMQELRHTKRRGEPAEKGGPADRRLQPTTEV
ncbi:hypothetical protein DFH09DRAFT_1087259 [Mycena vulgaris]|nr:hypothetical protein DFH09DRAFT_1087259 [Mycena vulgaris]